MDPKIGGVGVYHKVLAEKASWIKGAGILERTGILYNICLGFGKGLACEILMHGLTL
jgi:hypothetical protein